MGEKQKITEFVYAARPVQTHTQDLFREDSSTLRDERELCCVVCPVLLLTYPPCERVDSSVICELETGTSAKSLVRCGGEGGVRRTGYSPPKAY